MNKLILFTLLISFISCKQNKTDKTKGKEQIEELLKLDDGEEKVGKQYSSRQFEGNTEISALSSDNEEIYIVSKYYFAYTSDSKTDFDNKGYLINRNNEIESFTKSILNNAFREIIGKYDSKELSKIDKRNLTIYLQKSANKTSNGWKNHLQPKFNRIIIENFDFSHIVREAKRYGLLEEYNNLKNENPEIRLNAIKSLINSNNEIAISIVLNHWNDEKEPAIKDYITKNLTK